MASPHATSAPPVFSPKDWRERFSINDLEDLIPALMAETLERAGAADAENGADRPTVVDMGSGGQLGEFLSRVPLLRNARLVGVDIDAEALDRNESLDERVVADLEHDDLAAIPDASVDLVLSHWLFEHLRRVDVALAAIARILKPGGSAFVLVPNARSFKSRMAWAATALPIRGAVLGTIKVVTGKTKYFYPAYYKFCTPEQVDREAARAGLDVAALYFEELHYSFYDRLPGISGYAKRLSERRMEGHAPTTCSEMLVHLQRPNTGEIRE